MSDREELWRDYQQTLNSFRQLTDIRFKLLAFIPSISGLAVGAIAHDLNVFKDMPLPRLLIGLLGFLVTLGVVFYDQRNSQLYNALSHRARDLEEQLNHDGAGQFTSRPKRSLRFLGIFRIWHDRGLALIYAAVLGAWAFPVICGGLWVAKAASWGLPLSVPTISAIGSGAVILLMLFELQRLDRKSSRRAGAKYQIVDRRG